MSEPVFHPKYGYRLLTPDWVAVITPEEIKALAPAQRGWLTKLRSKAALQREAAEAALREQLQASLKATKKPRKKRQKSA